MELDKRKHQRRSIRLPGYDYAQAGAYFVTLCTHKREPLLGKVAGEAVVLNSYGQIAREEWLASEAIRREIVLDAFVIMPNHLHGIVWIVKADSVGATGRSPLLQEAPCGPAPRSLGAFIGGYKSAVTKRINEARGTPGLPVWQRNYWDHIIRNERALNAIREYIQDNPARWALDTYNPLATERDPHAVDLWRLLQES